MSQRKIGEPVSRNYSVSFTGPENTIEYYPDGTIRSNVLLQQPTRVAQLTVNNPWRQHKPSGINPTARTLLHWRRSAEHRVMAYVDGGSGRKVRVVGPNWHAVNNEWNNRYLSFGSRPLDSEQLRTEAVLDAMQKVKDQKWNAGVALAEASGVVSMAEDAMKLIANLRHDLRKKDFRAAYARWKKSRSKRKDFESYPAWRRKHWQEVRHVASVRRAKRIPEGWLYYHFGLKPTLNDITDAADAYATKLNPLLYGLGDNFLIAKGYAKQTSRVTRNARFPRKYNYRVHERTLHSVRVSIPVRPKAKYVAKLSELGVLNPVEAVYNKLPFSWVADYFSTFGDWLSVLDTSLGWVWNETWTESWRFIAKSRITPISDSIIWHEYPIVESVVSIKRLDRKVVVGLYGPMGTILPTWKRKGPSLTKIANLASVISQMFGSGVRIHP